MVDWLRLSGPAVLAWAFVAGKLYGRLRGRSQPSGTIWVLLLGLAGSLTAQTPAAYRAIAEFTGIPNISRLVAHVLMLVVVWATQMLLFRLDDTFTRYRWWLTGSIGLMTVLFALADTPVDDVRFAGRYGAAPWVLEYWLVFLVALTPAFVNTIRLGWRYSALSGSGSNKLGLRLIAAGAVSSFAYHIHKALFLAARRFDVYYPTDLGSVLDQLLPPVAAGLVILGATLPWWLSRLTKYVTYQRLRPLWLALYEANPGIALVPPRPMLLDLLLPRDLDLRLYRRVIEIRDGRLVLQPYLDPKVGAAARMRAAAAGVTGQKLDAIAEAATLDDALTRSARVGTACSDVVPGGRDLASDTAFLNEVARAYRGRPFQRRETA
ncbi:MAG: MAB_1171c family putative transporter [Kibdelosporangium sp.]